MIAKEEIRHGRYYWARDEDGEMIIVAPMRFFKTDRVFRAFPLDGSAYLTSFHLVTVVEEIEPPDQTDVLVSEVKKMFEDAKRDGKVRQDESFLQYMRRLHDVEQVPK